MRKTFVEQNTFGPLDNQYKFNGKELDVEKQSILRTPIKNKLLVRKTGLYYYGARFYDPRFSFWYGVDPLAEKFPGFSPYNYCLNNPVMLVDPHGRSADPPVNLDTPDGTVHADSDGTWIFNKAENVWKGQNGSPDYGNYIQGEEVVIDQYSRWQGTYFDRYHSKGKNPYSPDGGVTFALCTAGFILLPILALEMGGAAITAEIAGYSTVTTETAVVGVASNVLSQGIANSGDFRKVNLIEAGFSAVPGFGPTILGETFNYNLAEHTEGIQTPKTFDRALLQIGGGIFSSRFSSSIDSSPLFKNGAPKAFGNIASFGVETATNALPNVVK